jgi:hypothetical protein
MKNKIFILLEKVLRLSTELLLVVLTLLIIIFGVIGVYLAEHEHQGANITS